MAAHFAVTRFPHILTSDELFLVPLPLGSASVLFLLGTMFYVQNSNMTLTLRCTSEDRRKFLVMVLGEKM